MKWLKQEGDEMSAGDLVAEIETDKATMEWEVTDDGYIAKLFVADGTKDLAVGTPIMIVVEEKDDIAAFKDFKLETTSSASEPAPQETPKADTPAPSEKDSRPHTPSISFRSQKSESAPPSHSDVPGAPPAPRERPDGGRSARNQASSAPQAIAPAPSAPAAAYEDIENSNIRKVTASRLTESKQTVPHYYLTAEINMDAITKLRAELNESSDSSYKLSFNDFVIKASALALKKVPAVNSSWQGEFIRQYNSADINVAVATERGLLTPLLRNVEGMGLATISNSVKELAGRAKNNKLRPEEFASGTFTISNLGMMGIKQFTAVINPPQACILAVGATEAVVTENLTVQKRMTVTLSCDHRVVDGAVGAQWLQEFRQLLENPTKLLL